MDARDESRLNDWIEGEASPADEAAVNAMLDADPALAARVRAMRSDREALAGLAAPVVPAEVRAAIDDRVARMLLLSEPLGSPGLFVETTPADAAFNQAPSEQTEHWRARRRNRASVRWIAGVGSGVAAAALVTFALVIQGGGATPTSTDDALAIGSDAPGSGASVASATGRSFRPAEDAFIVHGLPLPSVAPAEAPHAMIAHADGERAMPRDPGGHGPVAAIRLAGLDVATLEARIAELAFDGSDATIVSITRNLTTDAVARMLPRDPGRGTEPLWADLDAARGAGPDTTWRDRVDQRINRAVGDRRGAAEERPAGVVIAGPESERPGWGEQIVFAEAGAEWTLSVRADRVAAALAAIEGLAGGSSGLVTIDVVDWSTVDGIDAWRAAREQLRRVATTHPDRIVHIPLVLGDG